MPDRRPTFFRRLLDLLRSGGSTARPVRVRPPGTPPCPVEGCSHYAGHVGPHTTDDV